MTGSRRRTEIVVARTPVRVATVGVALVALGNLVMLGSLWQWVQILDAPASVRWLIAGAAAANMVGGLLAMTAFGMVRS